MFEKTKLFCDSLLKMGVPGFDLAVFKSGKPILRYMNGYSSIEEKSKINGKERYNIYSCSKPITCTAALQLWGAAGAYLAVDIQNEISIYFACHLHSSPGQGVRSLLYRFIRAELFDNDDFKNIQKEIANLYDYNLTY